MMQSRDDAITQLSDAALLAEVQAAALRERQATVRLIALLTHLDARQLYLGEGCSSLFTYCTQVLHAVLNDARHKSKRDVESLAAARARGAPTSVSQLGLDRAQGVKRSTAFVVDGSAPVGTLNLGH